MKKPPLFRACILALILLATPSHARDVAPPFEGPPVAKLPNSCKYEITLLTALEVARKKWQEANPEAPQPVRRHSHRIVKWVVTKTGKTAFVETTEEGGKSGEFWVVDGALITKEHNSEAYWAMLANEASEVEETSFGRDQFPHTAWIKMDNFKAKTKWNGKPALEFASKSSRQSEGMGGEASEISQSDGDSKAWIDEETRFPLTIQVNGDTYTFKYFADPNRLLELPQSALDAYRREVDRQHALNTPPPPP